MATTPPSPATAHMYSCRPEHLIENYNQALRFVAARHPFCLPALGADNWLLHQQAGDQSYLDAFARLLKQA